jgi:hypothetical protein
MTGYLTRSLRQAAAGDTSHIIGLGLLIYVVMLAPMIVVGRGFQLAPVPHGTKVEQVFPRLVASRAMVTAHTYEDAGEWSRVVLYENANRLDPGNYEIKPFGRDGWATIELRSSDKTDPIENGHRYYIVLP